MPDDPARLLRRWRERNNVSQRALSVKLNCAVTDISRYESGAVKPSLDRAFDLEDLTGIPARAWRSSAAA